MTINNGLLKIFQFRKQLTCDLNAITKILLLNIISVVFIGFAVVFGAHAIYKTSYIFAGIFFLMAVLSTIGLILVNKTEKTMTAIYLVTLLYAALFFSVFVYHPGKLGFISIAFPMIALFLFGQRRGGLISVLFLIGFVAMLILVDKTSLVTVAVAVIAFGFIYLLAYLFLVLTAMRFSEMEKQMLEARNESKSKNEFISRLSHQIRTPLNNIMVVGDLLCNTPMDNNQKDMINTILASANNLVNVVNSLAKMTQIEVSKKMTEISFDLHTTIKNTVKLFSEQNASKVSIEYTSSSGLPVIIGDPIRVKQVFLYIIECFLKAATDDKIQIEIAASIPKEHDGMVDTSFIITGNVDINNQRMSADDEEESSFDTSIVQKLIDAYEGKINLNVAGNKTTLALTLRLRKSQQQEKAQPQVTDNKTAQAKTTATVTPKKITKGMDLKDATILLVEDNPINQKIAILSLNKYVKAIEVANNGKEALDKFGNSKYDLILMDIQMPIMDGITTTKKIREIEASTNSQIPIIAITANALSGDKEMCLAAGMNDYISKPYQIEDLLQKMKALIA